MRRLYFDTHAHYDDAAFDPDRAELLEGLPSHGVALALVPGCDLRSSEAAVALAKRYDHIYAAVGWHPEELRSFNESDFEKLRALAGHPKCVAVGEIGLDYYWDASRKEEQRELFRRQIELALMLDKPVIIHDREAHGDCMDMIRAYPKLRGVFHCFSGSAETAQELLSRGWYLGFDGPISYKNARKALEVLALCPMDALLLETDSPYLSPVPMRGKRNDSRNLVYIAQTAAGVKGCTPAELATAAMENGMRLFRISRERGERE